MRALLPLTLLLASVPAATREAPPTALAIACGPAAPKPPDEPACAGKPLCSAAQRVGLACELGDALASRYVFFPTKRAPGDGTFFSDASAATVAAPAAGADRSLAAHLAACVEVERAIAREDDPLRFYDRLRACTAALGDGHVILGVPAGVPTVALGVDVSRVGDAIVVASRSERLLKKLEAGRNGARIRDALAVGSEIVAIDGRPVRDAVAELARYVPGSSEAARTERAVDALTRRDFRFPEARTAALTVVVGGRRETVRLPWWISPDGRATAFGRAYADRVGLETTDLLGWGAARDRATGRAGRDVAGTIRTDPIVPPRDAAALRELLDERDRVAVRLGEVVRRRDRAFCYLQVLSFHTDTLATGASAERRPFGDAIDDFVRDCKEKELDVVVDLRQNEGGYLANASALVSALLPRGAVAPGGALLVRATDQVRAVYEERLRRRQWPSDGPDPSRVVPELSRARRAGKDFTPAFFEPPVRASERVGGYDGRVVALVSPACMSACDRAAAMLRATGRAVLVGEPTEGAGGSQQEVPGAIGTRWQDRDGLVWLAIPNAAMGVPPAAGDPGAPDADAFFRALALENRPVEPNVSYAPRLEDVTEHGRGWLGAVDATLFPPQAASVAAVPPRAPAQPAAPAPAKVPAAVDTATAPPPPAPSSAPAPAATSPRRP